MPKERHRALLVAGMKPLSKLVVDVRRVAGSRVEPWKIGKLLREDIIEAFF